MKPLTQQGIAALKLGDRTAARQLLAAAIKQDPRDVTAWLWLAGALDKEAEQIDCLRYVLKIDPQNQLAMRGLERLTNHSPAPEPPVQAAPPVVLEATPPARQMEPEPTPPPPPEPISMAPEEAQTEYAPSSQAAIDAMRESVQVMEEPEPVPPAGEPAPAPRPFHRRAARPAEEETARLIFRSRPSLVPALICFWLFLFGALTVGSLLSGVSTIGLPLAGGVGFLLQVVVLYTVIRGLAERYELTSQQLTLRLRGKRARIPISEIYHAEFTQSFFQRLLGIGTIEIDAAVNGQLTHLRLRNIPQYRQRTDQIMYLVKDYAST